MIAADIMEKDVVTIREDQTLKELAELLISRRISGAPVVDAEGRLVGVVSQTDLVRRDREEEPPHEAPSYHQNIDRWLGRQGFQVEAPDYALVRDVMTPVILSAAVDTPLGDLARLMTRKRIHRLVIMRGGRLAGIVTSMDVMRAFAGLASKRRKGAHA
jgi:CBS domain-containing protein